MFYDSANFYKHFILIQLVFGTLFMASNLFQFELVIAKLRISKVKIIQSNFLFQTIKHLDMSFLLFIGGLTMSIMNLFFYCFYGKSATEYYLHFADLLFESKWYELPNQYQKFIILMLENAQRPIYYHGSNIAYLNLETFTKAIQYQILNTHSK